MERSWFSSDELVVGIATVFVTGEKKRKKKNSLGQLSPPISQHREYYLLLMIFKLSIFNRDFIFG